MSEINTGGPAYPLNWEKQGEFWAFGMTMRDYFAAKALPTVSSYWVRTDGPLQDYDVVEIIARDCYIVADALLKERNKSE